MCTQYPEINKLNVDKSVLQGGHFVEPATIENRFYKTLNNLSQLSKMLMLLFYFKII